MLQSNEKDDWTIKLTDFGFAKTYDEKTGLTDTLGSPIYMAPEIIMNVKYGYAVDIWATGILLYILLVGIPPFAVNTEKEIFALVKNQGVELNGKAWEKMSP